MLLAELDLEQPTLVMMLRPALRALADPARRVTTVYSEGRIAVLPLSGTLSDDEVYTACRVHTVLDRGVLVLT